MLFYGISNVYLTCATAFQGSLGGIRKKILILEGKGRLKEPF